MTDFSTIQGDNPEDNPSTCHENVANPVVDGSMVNSEPGMSSWTPASWSDYRSMIPVALKVVAVYSIGYFIWRWW